MWLPPFCSQREACATINIVRLITFRKKSRNTVQEKSREEIGALTDGNTEVIRLQAAEELRGGQPDPRLASMIAFLEGGAAARATAPVGARFCARAKTRGRDAGPRQRRTTFTGAASGIDS